MHFPFSLHSSAGYFAVATSDNRQNLPKSFSNGHRRVAFPLALVISHSFFALLGYLGTTVYTREQPTAAQLPQAVSCHCGSNIAEAEPLGCKYDSLSLSWLPAQCRDDDLTAEFEHAGPNPDGSWPYFADKAANVSMSLEEVAQLADLPRAQAVVYTTTGWHVAHCAFYWRKEYRMRAKGSMMESRYDTESHIKHCYMTFM